MAYESLYIPVALGITLLGSLVSFKLPAEVAKRVGILVSLVPLALGVLAVTGTRIGAGAYTAEDMSYYGSWEWIPAIGASASFGIDGISGPMVFLTGLLTTLVLWFSWDIKERTSAYVGLMLLLEVAVIGVFVALDYFFFYIFWELVLLPMFFLILLWGGPNRKYAAVKFLTYTFIASLVMLIGIMTLYAKGPGTFDYFALLEVGSGLSRTLQAGVFATFLVGFGTKMPLVPVHTWLPDAHVQAPTGGSVILAGVLLKLGAYGFLRFAFPTLPQGVLELQPLLVFLAIVAILWPAFVALGQRDLKSVIAYSSISHMGMVLLGFATLHPLGMVGGMYMMFAHGLISPALFMAAGVVQHAAGTRLIPELGGIALRMPKGVALGMAAFMASLGLPGMAGFVAEVLIFLGTYKAFGFTLLFAVAAVPLTAGYYLWAAKRAFFGELTTRIETAKIHDITRNEFWPLFILVVLSIVYGVAPMLLTDILTAGSDAILGTMDLDVTYAVEGVSA